MVTVARGLQLSLVLDQLEEFLAGRRDLFTILVSPSVRFVRSCCLAHDSLTETEKIEEGKRQLRELGSHRREIRNWLYRKEFRNVVLVDPLEANGAAACWETAKELMVDNVHMKQAGYSRLALAIREAIQKWMLGRKRKGTELLAPSEKKIRLGEGGSGPKGGPGAAGGRGKGAPTGYGKTF